MKAFHNASRGQKRYLRKSQQNGPKFPLFTVFAQKRFKKSPTGTVVGREWAVSPSGFSLKRKIT